MVTDLEVFSNKTFGQVRAIVKDGGIWFAAADVCDSLKLSNPRSSLALLDKDEKGVHTMDTPGGKQEMTMVSEPGLYSLVLKSRKPEAKAFKRWITHDVIPAIRKHGGYLTPEKTEEILLNPDVIIKLATELKNERAKVAELKPKADYHDAVLNSKSLMSVTQIAKDYGKSAVWLNNYLAKKHIQYKQGKVWLLYAKYAKQGYAHSVTHAIDADHTKETTKWTQKGRKFIGALIRADKKALA